MIDQTTLAYVNLFAVLGAMENMCEIDDEAKSILVGKKPVSIGFAVKDGPSAVLSFENGKCTLTPNAKKSDIKFSFASAEKFNGAVEGTIMPIPIKINLKVPFLFHEFMALVNRLTVLLHPSDAQLEDEKFKETSSLLTFYTVTSAISQIANHDNIGKFSAKTTTDGDIAFAVSGGPEITFSVKNHQFTTVKKQCEQPSAKLVFGNMQIACDVFAKRADAIACVSDGSIEITGMLGNLANVNRILDRVSEYLA